MARAKPFDMKVFNSHSLLVHTSCHVRSNVYTYYALYRLTNAAQSNGYFFTYTYDAVATA